MNFFFTETINKKNNMLELKMKCLERLGMKMGKK